MVRYIVLVVALVATPAVLAKGDAECDAEAVLVRLQSEVIGELNERQAENARAILQSLCKSPETAEPTKVLGIELRSADKDSKGHERLRRRH
ncbi:MAG: hypothetical protein O7C67_02435 [Gammaproteobacteria bacterium]|nr:hypothetical protein [Gammaproteobacteria bacterium]